MIEFVAGTSRTAATIKLLPAAGATKEELQAEARMELSPEAALPALASATTLHAIWV